MPDDNYGNFLRKYTKKTFEPGPIKDLDGKIIGKHKGIIYYTIGQRKGLGISSSDPLYVLSIDTKTNSIIVGKKEHTMGNTVFATKVNFISGLRPKRKIAVKAKIRYNARDSKAILYPLDKDRLKLEFINPQNAITPGQSVVFYNKDIVIGGGIIEKLN